MDIPWLERPHLSHSRVFWIEKRLHIKIYQPLGVRLNNENQLKIRLMAWPEIVSAVKKLRIKDQVDTGPASLGSIPSDQIWC